MITLGFIKAGAAGKARVDYYLSRAQLESYDRAAPDRADAAGRLGDPAAMAAYYGSHSANGPGRWAGRGAAALGLDGAAATPEAFTRAVLEGYVDGAVRARPVWRTHPAGLVAAEPFAAAARAEAAWRGVDVAVLFGSGRDRIAWAGLAGKAERFGQVPATLVGKLARSAGLDPAGLYGAAQWAQALVMAAPDRRVDDRLAAVDVVMSADKSVSLLYATADPATRSLIVSEFRGANRAALGYLDDLAAAGRRGKAGASEVGTDGLLAVGFLHDEARPTADCACGDPHLHEHMIVLNTVRGEDGGWSAAQLDRLAPAAKTAGYLLQAELRARLAATLGVVWRPVVNGLSGVAGITDAQHRTFSKRHAEVADELAAAGAEGLTAGNLAGRDTKQAKRAQLPLAERVARWQAEAATVGLDQAALAGVLDRVGSADRARSAAGGELDAAVLDTAVLDTAVLDRAVLAALTARASSFGRPDLLRELAGQARQGASVAVLTARADRILSNPALVVPLDAGQAGLTTGDVRRSAAGGRVFAYAVEQKWTTPEQLLLERRLVDAALARQQEGCAVLDAGLVEQVIGGQPFVLSDEQAAAVRALTTSGAGVDVLQAGAGSGKTSAVLGTVRQAYESAGYRVIGAATSAKAARVLADDGGLATSTVARLLLDLQRPDTGRLGPGTVLVIDEASMVGTRDLTALLEHARHGGAKVLTVGDTRQLTAVDAGGGLRALTDRLGAQTLVANRRQHAGWERAALASLAAGQPGPALRAYAEHGRVTVTDSGLAARRAMVTAWWADAAEHGIDKTLLVAVRNTDRVELNRLARDVMREAGRLGDEQVTASGRSFAVGDRVILLRNSSSRRYDNGDTGTVVALDDGRLVVQLDRGAVETLDRSYTAGGHVDHAYAGTVHKAQGGTVATAHVLGTALAQESGYVALSRGRTTNRLYLVEGEQPIDPELDLPTPAARLAYQQAARTLGTSQAKRLALDTSVWGAAADELVGELAVTARLLRDRPPSDAARMPAVLAQQARLVEQIARTRERVGALQDQHDGLRRRSGQRPALQARIAQQTAVLGRLDEQLADVQATVAAVEDNASPAQVWADEHAPVLSRAVAAGREVAWRTRAAERAVVTALEPAWRDPTVEVPAPALEVVPAPDVERAPVQVRGRSL